MNEKETENRLRECYPLHFACLFGDVGFVQKLLCLGHDACQIDNARSWAPSHYAAYEGHVSLND